MLLPDPHVPILVIEDDDKHRAQIAERLTAASFNVQFLLTRDKDELLAHKANYDSQIIVVDLNLKGMGSLTSTEGWDIITDHLWPADRSAYFIIFTENWHLVDALDNSVPQPNITVVGKQVTGGDSLTSSCLESLVYTADQCRQYCAPVLSVPLYSERQFNDDMQRFVVAERSSGLDLVSTFNNALMHPIIRSTDRLNECVRATASFNRAGMVSARIAVVVYGSFGRLEARPSSDIEMSVLYDEAEGSALSNAAARAVAFGWYCQMTKYFEKQKWEYEGEQERTGRPLFDAAEDDLRNEYLRIIRIPVLLRANLKKSPQVRSRYLQVLTEMKPVFNPGLLLELKKMMLLGVAGVGAARFKNILYLSSLYDAMDEFFTDAVPVSVETVKDWKSICYRLFNLLALRLCLIELYIFSTAPISSEAEWGALFDRLSSPGLHKVLSFLDRCRLLRKDAKSKATATLHSTCFDFAIKYAEAIGYLLVLEEEAGHGDAWKGNLRRQVQLCLDKYLDLSKAIDHVRSFNDLQEVPRLRGVGRVEQLRDEIK